MKYGAIALHAASIEKIIRGGAITPPLMKNLSLQLNDLRG